MARYPYISELQEPIDAGQYVDKWLLLEQETIDRIDESDKPTLHDRVRAVGPAGIEVLGGVLHGGPRLLLGLRPRSDELRDPRPQVEELRDRRGGRRLQARVDRLGLRDEPHALVPLLVVQREGRLLRVRIHLGALDAAAEYFQAAARQGPPYLGHHLFCAAQCHEATSNLDEAMRIYHQLLVHSPENPSVIVAGARLARRTDCPPRQTGSLRCLGRSRRTHVGWRGSGRTSCASPRRRGRRRPAGPP